MNDAHPVEKLSCKQVSRILSDGLDHHMPAELRAKLQVHLDRCDACRGFEQQMQQLRRVMRGLGSERPPGSGSDGD